MNYYILQQDPRVQPQPSVLACPAHIEPQDWLKGIKMPAPQNPLQLKMSPRSGKFRGVIIGGVLTFFHDVFRAELTRLGIDNIQYFPVALENPEGEIETKYSLINIIGMLNAVDKTNSVLVPRAVGGRPDLKSFKIDEAAAQGHRIFRIPEASNLIIIDETLQASLECDDFNLAGAWALPTEEYDGW